MDITTYKQGKKIVCYIKHYDKKHIVCTGKPSDLSCLSWQYDNIEDAEKTANEYFINRTNFFKS